jgi:hypothetical protein
MFYEPTCKSTTAELSPWRKGLLRAADYIDQHGWCQHAGTINGHVCVRMAMRMVGCQEVAFGVMNEVVGGSIIEWNDAVGRTKEEVVAALRGAANS